VGSKESVSAWRQWYHNPPLDAGVGVSDDASPMPESLLVLALVILLAVLVLVVVLLVRPARVDLSGIEARLAAVEAGHEQLERAIRDELAQGRAESTGEGRALREEVGGAVGRLGDSLSSRLGAFSDSNERRMDALRQSVEERLRALLEDNAARLEQVRVTVDERLQGTLEARLGESFRAVSERLEQVHRGLGEMQVLAAGVGDLKKVLTNVKTRGTWGEVQLGALLEQVLAPAQYDANVATKAGSSDRVEFAIKLPGRDPSDPVVWLPIDAKFPQEDYQRLLEAADRGDGDAVEAAAKSLDGFIKQAARDIRDKYLDSPHTTDFGVLFLPTEGLYAEVLRRPGLSEAIQRDMRVVLAGPTTLWAILNSLQMGFRTLAIEKRSGEVWAVLGTVKTQFAKFGDIVSGVQKKLQEATNKMDAVAQQSRTIQRKLRDVQELPAGDPTRPGLPSPGLLEPLDAPEPDEGEPAD
jgi:DNA recombination protein RmuC